MVNHKIKSKGRWKGLLRLAGLNERHLLNKHTDCPICQDGKDRYRFDDKGDGLYYCNQCGAGDGFSLLQKVFGYDFKQSCDFIDKFVDGVKMENVRIIDEEKRINDLKKVWTTAVNVVENDDVSVYLQSRGLEVPKVLKNYLQMPYVEDGKTIGQYNVMLARVQNAHGDSANIHRTYLLDGQKADVPVVKKLMTGINFQGGAIRLYNPTDTLGVAEGIETAIACKMMFNIPTWSLINAGNMKAFIPPKEVKNIVIFSDNDKNYTGQSSAYVLANRLTLEGLNVDVFVSTLNDFADDLISGNDFKDSLTFVKEMKEQEFTGEYTITQGNTVLKAEL
jgi:putative DNA primase/helicase